MKIRTLGIKTVLAASAAAAFVVSGLSLSTVAVRAAGAGLSLIEDFSGNALPDTLEETGSVPVYSNGAVLFPNSDRGYLRTIANYNTAGFIADATVTVSSDYGPYGIAFFGMGAGEPASWFFDEPRESPTTYVRISPDNFGGAFGITTSDAENIGSSASGGDGTHRVRVTWNPLTSTFTAAIQQNYSGGPFVPTTTIGTVVAEPFGDTNTRIFFGGSGDATFDDFQVLALAGTPGKANCSGTSTSAIANDLGGLAQAAAAFGFPSVKSLQAFIKASCGS